MNHIQNILQSAVSRIVEGSTVANINEISANNYTFTTTDLKNIRVGLSVLIGGIKFRITAINTKTKTVSIYGFVLPEGTEWQLALYFRYGSRIEVNALLKDEVAVRKEAFPFIWLILNFQQTPQPQAGLNAYSTEIKLFFVNSSEEKIVAKDRLAQNFESVFDNITELFFAELNKLPTAANFARKLNEPINGKMIDRYFFGSQENNSNVIAVNQTDAREYDISLTVLPSACLGSNSNFLPALIPSFSLTDNGTDVEAFTNELFTIRKTLKNTTVDLRPVPYSVAFDWGVLGTEIFSGTLNFGESVNLVSAKVLTGITGAYSIDVNGSVQSIVSINVQIPVVPAVLYNHYAIQDLRGIGIAGFHVPTLAELNTLISFLGGTTVAGGKLKQTGFANWSAPNTGATNQSGFTAFGNGTRFGANGAFISKKQSVAFWANDVGRRMFLGYNFASASTTITDNYNQGYSIRLIKDNSIPSVGAITDLDGNIYTEVVIGTQIWLVEDLRVTKYLTGATIPEVTDDTAWSLLTTGAMCYY